jgi:ABC-type lipoprotein export system ATPase subunit
MGERQRVTIARALAAEPRLLLADEPTGNLDSNRTNEILKMLREICCERGLPGLLVTHDPDAVAFVDRVHTLRDGCLYEGPPEAKASSARKDVGAHAGTSELRAVEGRRHTRGWARRER